MRRALLALPVLALVGSSAASQEDLEDVLLFARAAQSVASRPSGIVVRGESEVLGTKAKLRLAFDDHQRFRMDLDGRLERLVGHDGERTWERFHGAGPFELRLTLREEALLFTWVWTGQWVFPDTPLELELLKSSKDEIRLGLSLEGGAVEAELALDPRTHLPRTLEMHGGQARASFEEWGSEAGVPLPRLVRQTLGPSRELVHRVTSIEAETLRKGAFAPPPPSDDADFDRWTESALDLVSTPTGHLLVRAAVGGEDVGWFLFDTGAGLSGLHPAAVDRLGLVPFGRTGISGVGGHGGERRMCQAPLTLGPLTIRDVVFTQNEKGRQLGPVEGDPVVGVLGWDVLARGVVVVDVAGGTLEVHAPEAFDLTRRFPEATWQPLVLHHRVPHVTARFEGNHEGLFLLDTGAGSLGCVFFHHATTALDLLAGRDTEPLQGQGVGGEVSLRLGTLEWIELGGMRVESPTTAFSVAEDGEADPYSLGVLGNGVLGRVRVVLDCPHERVAFLSPAPDPADEAR